MIPEIFRISIFEDFSIPIFSFGLMMLLCFLGSMILLQSCLKEAGENPMLAEPMVTYAAIGGVIGARFFSIISYPNQLMEDPIGVIFSSAGFVFYGGFIGGFIAVFILLRKNKIPFLKFTNIVAAPLAFGYAIGRVGCQLSGDGDYGIESSLPWAMNYIYGVIPTASTVHPTPVYESLISLFLAIFLRSTFLKNKLRFDGQLFGFYLIISGVSRYFIENLRVEPRVLSGFSQAQLISIPLILIGIFLIFNF